MSDYIERVDHTERAQNNLTWSLQKENFLKFVKVYSDELNVLEDTFLILANQKDIDIAEGVWLDYIGKLVGIQRNGADDERYRELIRLQIGINTSDGNPNTIMSLVQQYTEATEIQYSEGGTAFFTLYTNGLRNNDASLWLLLEDIRPVATKCIIKTDPTGGAFRPAWEVSVAEAERFQTTDDGVAYENFQATTDGINYEDFYVFTKGRVLANTDLERSIPAWEVTGQVLTVTIDGEEEILEVTVDGVTSPLIVSGPATLFAQAGESIMQAGEPLAQAGNSSAVYSTDKYITACWEVNENSVQPPL